HDASLLSLHDALPILLQPESVFTLRDVRHCRMDDRGKVCFGQVDHFAPPAETGEYREAARVIAAVDARCNQALLADWEQYPDLLDRKSTRLNSSHGSI